MAVFKKCPCGFVYREDSTHGSICRHSKHPHDPIATKEEIRAFKAMTYSCLLCGTTTPLPHVCPVFYSGLRQEAS